ncbi:hypothetical protein SDC9_122746 [bioreactor metagenome]|uniref:Uncharacterized protein n=1 Tax=bioreactor metagenome TaxID=1076179 RepID=A0A645CFX5_9ZZZZ
MARERVRAVFAHKAVGVVLAGKEQKFHAARVAGIGQGAVQRLAGRAASGGVAVEAEHHCLGEAEQLVYMIGRAGRAQRGHGVAKTELGERHHVHIALGDQGVAVLADGGAGFEQSI